MQECDQQEVCILAATKIQEIINQAVESDREQHKVKASDLAAINAKQEKEIQRLQNEFGGTWTDGFEFGKAFRKGDETRAMMRRSSYCLNAIENSKPSRASMEEYKRQWPALNKEKEAAMKAGDKARAKRARQALSALSDKYASRYTDRHSDKPSGCSFCCEKDTEIERLQEKLAQSGDTSERYHHILNAYMRCEGRDPSSVIKAVAETRRNVFGKFNALTGEEE